MFAKLVLASHKLYGFDNVMAGWEDVLLEARAHGMVWKWPELDFYHRVDRYLDMGEADQLTAADP